MQIMITLKINGKEVKARAGWTILETAREHGFDIPTLCFHPAVSASGACRLCMVELRDGDWSKLVASCIYPVADGLNVHTETPRVNNVRKWVLEMLAAACPASPEIEALAVKYNADPKRFKAQDPNQACLVCGLCARVCEEVVGLSAIAVVDRGVYKRVGAPFAQPTDICVACGSCVTVCPTGAMQSIFDTVRGVPATALTQLA